LRPAVESPTSDGPENTTMPVPENMTMRGAAGSAPDAGLGVTAGGRSALLALEEVASACATSAAPASAMAAARKQEERRALIHPSCTGGAEKQRTDGRALAAAQRAGV